MWYLKLINNKYIKRILFHKGNIYLKTNKHYSDHSKKFVNMHFKNVNQLHDIQWYGISWHFILHEKLIVMWAFMGLWLHAPKNSSTVCAEINPWSKFYNSWRKEAQTHCRLKVERNFLQSIYYLGKKKSFSSWNNTPSREQIKLLFFQKLFFLQVWIWVVEKIWLHIIFQILYLPISLEKN